MANIIKSFFGNVALFFFPKVKAKTQKVCEDHEKLIAEYFRIKHKKSLLPKSERDAVVQKINNLVALGHIKAS